MSLSSSCVLVVSPICAHSDPQKTWHWPSPLCSPYLKTAVHLNATHFKGNLSGLGYRIFILSNSSRVVTQEVSKNRSQKFMEGANRFHLSRCSVCLGLCCGAGRRVRRRSAQISGCLISSLPAFFPYPARGSAPAEPALFWVATACRVKYEILHTSNIHFSMTQIETRQNQKCDICCILITLLIQQFLFFGVPL